VCVCVCRLSVSIVRVSSLLNGSLTWAFSDIKANTDASCNLWNERRRRLTDFHFSKQI